MRNANIAVAIAAVIIFGGAFLFRHAGEGALQIVMLVALVAAFGTVNALDARDRHRQKRSGSHQ